MEIRPPGVDDAAAIAAVHTQAWRETYRGLIPDRVIDAHANLERQTVEWQARLAEDDPERGVFVAEEAGRVRGFIWIAPGDDAVRRRIPEFDAHLYALYVLRSDHRRGTGRALIRAGVDALSNRGRRSLSLDVLAANPARTFYERLGAQLLFTSTIRDGPDAWEQCAYGWPNVAALRGSNRDRPT